MDNTILSITEAKYVESYKIRVRFNDGTVKLIDFFPIVGKGIGLCKKLADLNYFKNFTLDPFTID